MKANGLKIVTLITFLIMVMMNGLANALPINGITTGEVSDSYPNLFAPIGLTFAIWGVIYLLLALYTGYQMLAFKTSSFSEKSDMFKTVNVWFVVSSIVNSIWIVAWHYRWIAVTMFLMVILLVCLIIVNQFLKNRRLTTGEKILVRLPFSVYFGWITVATIANMTTLLVAINWTGWGLTDTVWTNAILLVGVLIGALTIIRNHDVAYGLVFIWAYVGILMKHLSESGFDGAYFSVIVTVVISLALFIATVVHILFFKRKETRNRVSL